MNIIKSLIILLDTKDVSGENVPITYFWVKNIYTSGILSLNMLDNLTKRESLSDYSTSLYEVEMINDPVTTNPSESIMAIDVIVVVNIMMVL